MSMDKYINFISRNFTIKNGALFPCICHSLCIQTSCLTVSFSVPLAIVSTHRTYKFQVCKHWKCADGHDCLCFRQWKQQQQQQHRILAWTIYWDSGYSLEKYTLVQRMSVCCVSGCVEHKSFFDSVQWIMITNKIHTNEWREREKTRERNDEAYIHNPTILLSIIHVWSMDDANRMIKYIEHKEEQTALTSSAAAPTTTTTASVRA